MKSPYKLHRRYRRRDSYVTTLQRLYEYGTSRYYDRQMNRFSDGTGGYTYKSFKETVDALSVRLSRYGISAGDKVAILAQNMPNWTVAFFAATAFGRVAIPILPDSSESEVSNILSHSESKVIFVSKRLLGKVSDEARKKLRLVIDIETLDFIQKDSRAFRCDGWTKEPAPDDLATIIYTSGTTGAAKGVMLSHRNLSANVIAAFYAQPADKDDRWLSILPMAHTYEMALGCLYPVLVGGCVTYIMRPPTVTVLLGVMKQLRPTIICTVPLIIEKVYKNSILPTIQGSRVLSWMRDKTPRLLHYLVGKRLKRTFGGRLKFFGVGGSKLDPTVEAFLQKAHFPYAIGYGLTECAPLVCNAMVGRTRVGSIGIPSYGVEVRLGNPDPKTGEGEILARGANVMIGYYLDPERTLKVLDDDGWFHTNDVAAVDKDGNYYIRGRLNNTIIGATGENIYPEEIEKVLNDFDGVSESLVMERDGKLVALVKFDDTYINWDQATEDRFFDRLQSAKASVMEFVNKRVSKGSKIQEVDAMKDPFEKTATQKIRRYKYKDSHGDEPEKPAGDKKE